MTPECPTSYGSEMLSRNESEELSRNLTIEYSIIRHIPAASCEKREPRLEARRPQKVFLIDPV